MYYSNAEKTHFTRYIIVSMKKVHPLTFEDLKSDDSCILKFRLWVLPFRLICWQFAKLVWYISNRTFTTARSMREYQLYNFLNVKLPINIDKSVMLPILLVIRPYAISIYFYSIKEHVDVFRALCLLCNERWVSIPVCAIEWADTAKIVVVWVGGVNLAQMLYNGDCIIHSIT